MVGGYSFGIDEVIIVTGWGKRTIEYYFDLSHAQDTRKLS
jgi:UTP-glucose-1-phosphate uridylyltransferase